AAVRARWLADVLPTLEAIGLRVPEGFAPSEFDRQHHTDDLEALIAEMQSVARMEPEGAW
ncbi:MAG TPA: Phenylacetic acid catabolic protein, partial [Anaerolineales bacterium]|nr:Phenylacetic acid catabolic protein [Anaerolineales bacterium]